MPPLQTVAFLRTAEPGSRAPLADFSPLDRGPLPTLPTSQALSWRGRWGGELSLDATSSEILHSSSWKALPASYAVASALFRALARRPSPASALPLCVPNLSPWQQCGWCESLRGRSHYKRPQAERPLAPRAGSTGAGQAPPPPPTSPPSPRPPGSLPAPRALQRSSALTVRILTFTL